MQDLSQSLSVGKRESYEDPVKGPLGSSKVHLGREWNAEFEGVAGSGQSLGIADGTVRV